MLAIATLALADLLAKEKVSTWLREPFVREAPDHKPVAPEGAGVRHAFGELLTCTRCVGTWSALALVGLRTASPAAGRATANVLALAGANDLIQSGSACWRSGRTWRSSRRSAPAAPSRTASDDRRVPDHAPPSQTLGRDRQRKPRRLSRRGCGRVRPLRRRRAGASRATRGTERAVSRVRVEPVRPYRYWVTPAGRAIRANLNEHAVVLTGMRRDGSLQLVNVLRGTREAWARARSRRHVASRPSSGRDDLARDAQLR